MADETLAVAALARLMHALAALGAARLLYAQTNWPRLIGASYAPGALAPDAAQRLTRSAQQREWQYRTARRAQTCSAAGRRASLLRAFAPAALALLLTLTAAPLSAQRPRWDVWRRTEDQAGVVTVRAPRLVLEAFRADGGATAYRGLRWAAVPPRWAAPTAAVLSGVLPHVVGAARHRYGIDAGDWAADAWIAGGSAYVARAYERKRHRALVTAVYAVGWALAAGWASP